MADTGAPWNLPYPLPSDLVKDGATAIQDLAEDVAAALSAAGGLVAVKYAIKTDTQSSSLAAGAQTTVTGLSIAHSTASATNTVILLGNVVAGVSSLRNFGLVLTAGGANIAVGDTAGSRRSVTTAFKVSQVDGADVASGSVMARHSPGVTTSVTYTIDILNADTGTNTLLVNRANSDTDAGTRIRGVSTLILMEVKV